MKNILSLASISKKYVKNYLSPLFVGLLTVVFTCFFSINALQANNNSIYLDSSIKSLNINPIAQTDVLHIFSHGKPGELLIENKWLDAYSIREWLISNNLLLNKKHINIYGCEFGKGEKGKAAADYLEAALNVTIAASDDITGIDGDWELEVGKAIAAIKIQKYPYNLQCDCQDYMYIHDFDLDLIHKFPINADGSLGTEIGSPWSPSSIGNTHGLVLGSNGNIYVDADGSLVEMTCDGTVTNSNFVPSGWNGSVWNLSVIDNTLYSIVSTNNGNVWRAVDLCTGAIINTFDLSNGGNGFYWGQTYCEDDGKLYYAGTGLFGTNGAQDEVINIYSIDSGLTTETLEISHDFYTSVGACNSRFTVLGIAKDEFGNWYVMTNCNNNNGTVIKLDANGNYIDHISDSASGGGGYFNGWGLRYHNGFVYVTSFDACAAIFSSGGQSGSLTYLPAFEVPVESNASFPKGIDITTECCPTSTPQIIDQTYCEEDVPLTILLDDIYECDGIICEGKWETVTIDATFTYEPCAQSVEATGIGCATFTKSSDGTGANMQCGAFEITMNVCVEECLSVFDLALDKVVASTNDLDGSGSVTPGDEVIYTVTVYNQGGIDATDIVVADYLPTGMSFVSSPDFTLNGAVYEATIASLAAGANQPLTLILSIDAGATGTLTNNAEITSADDDGDAATPAPVDEDSPIDASGSSDDTTEVATDNDIADDSTGGADNPADDDTYDPAQVTVGNTITVFDLALDKVIASTNDLDGDGNFSVGDEVVYTITVYNQGTVDATDVIITDYLPTGMSFVSSPDYTLNGAVYEATIASLLAGASQALTLTLSIDAGATGTLINNAEITSADDDGNPATPPPTDEDSAIDVSGMSDDTSEIPTDNDVDDNINGGVDNPADDDTYDPAQLRIGDVINQCPSSCINQYGEFTIIKNRP